MIKKFIVVIVILVVVLGGVYGWHKFMAYEGAKYMAKFAHIVSTVSVTDVTAEEWHNFVPAVGSTIANQGVNVNAEVGGQITKIFFQSGDKVQIGQPIAQLNSSVLEAQLASDQANLNYSKLSYLRQKALAAQNVTSYSDLDQALATYQEDLAKVQQTQALLAQTFIRAPFTGLLGIRQVNLGQYVTAGQAIVSLQALQPMYVDFDVPENEVADIQVGYVVTMTTLAYPGKVFSGKIIAANSSLDGDTRTLQVRASIDNPDNLVLPGMFANINVVMPQVVKVLVVPQIAINYSPIGDFVYVVKNKIANRVYITLGERREDKVAVLTGLAVGDQVVYAGQVKINNGSAVNIEKNS